MVGTKKGICKTSTKRPINDVTPPIQFRNHVILGIENAIHHIADTIPKAVFIYNFIKRFNIRFILAMAGVTNKWVLFTVLLLI